MKKRYILLFSFLISFVVKAQTFDDFKKSDTLYFYFSANKSQQKYDLFTKQHETVSFEDLNNFSEKQLEELFARTRNICIVENFIDNEYVLPLLVKPTSEWVDFVKQNND